MYFAGNVLYASVSNIQIMDIFYLVFPENIRGTHAQFSLSV